MLTGIRKDKIKVLAKNSYKEDGPFFCPSCHGELVIRKGNIKIHHFAHKPPFNCEYGTGETESHKKCKESIYNALSQCRNVKDLEMEKYWGKTISDIYCRINNCPVAIEIQRSNLSVNNIINRTIAYHQNHIHVLWLGLYNEKLIKEKYSPSAWEKWCHAVYFGRVYYWISDKTVIPVHYNSYQLSVGFSEWYNEYGEQQSAGGYERISKRYRTPIFGSELYLDRDFRTNIRKEWGRGTIHVPSCRIYIDKRKKWW